MASLTKSLYDLLKKSEFEDVVEDAMKDSNFSETNEAIADSLKNLLSPHFPNVKIYTVGSREIGVATASSFLDVYIDTDNSYNTLGVDKNISERTTKVQEFLLCSNQWRDIRVVDEPVSLIKAHHDDLNIDCNLSFSDGMGHRNTELIKFLCEFQPMLRDMIVFLKIWLKRAELSDCITNYTLTLLIINFLQHKRILPSIKALQKEIYEPVRIGPWNVDFDRTSIGSLKLESARNLQGLTMLFFKFFSSASKFKHVISPYLGVLAPKTYFTQNNGKCFESYSTYADKYNESFTFGPMNVQGPFNLAENSAKCVTGTQLQRFVDLCEESYPILDDLLGSDDGYDYWNSDSDYNYSYDSDF